MNFLGFSITALAIVLIFSKSKQSALIGMMIGILYLTQNQSVTIAGINVYALRFVETSAILRILLRKEFSLNDITVIDKLLVLFLVYTTVAYGLRTLDGLTYRLAYAIDGSFCYFTFRALIKSEDDLQWFLKALVFLFVPYSLFVLFESFTGKNIFAIIGGRIGGPDLMRGGRLRACGTFRHPSLLGTVGASFIPFYLGLWFHKHYRKSACIGLVACLGIVLASNSGGPLSCVMVGLTGWACWKLRTKMKVFKISLIAAVVFLALIMKAPIWYLLAKISSITGGDGYHRSRLLEQAFNHLNDWWFLGMSIEKTQNWFGYYIHRTGGADITNQFISFGISGGIGSILLFLFLLQRAFSVLGTRFKKSNLHETYLTTPSDYLRWGMGVVLVVHITNWLGISYFDQSFSIWYAQLAIVNIFLIQESAPEEIQVQEHVGYQAQYI
jgi:hypothetical protein